MDFDKLLIILTWCYPTDFEKHTSGYCNFVYWKKNIITLTIILGHEMSVPQIGVEEDLYLWLRLKLLWG